jgi:hypothetical protein
VPGRSTDGRARCPRVGTQDARSPARGSTGLIVWRRHPPCRSLPPGRAQALAAENPRVRCVVQADDGPAGPEERAREQLRRPWSRRPGSHRAALGRLRTPGRRDGAGDLRRRRDPRLPAVGRALQRPVADPGPTGRPPGRAPLHRPPDHGRRRALGERVRHHLRRRAEMRYRPKARNRCWSNHNATRAPPGRFEQRRGTASVRRRRRRRPRLREQAAAEGGAGGAARVRPSRTPCARGRSGRGASSPTRRGPARRAR